MENLGQATANKGVASNGYLGKAVGYSYNASMPYCGSFPDITTETSYYVVNGLNSGNSQYWSNTSQNQPRLLWE